MTKVVLKKSILSWAKENCHYCKIIDGWLSDVSSRVAHAQSKATIVSVSISFYYHCSVLVLLVQGTDLSGTSQIKLNKLIY